MDCETSDRFVGDWNIWQFSNWRSIVGFPELESLPVCLAKTQWVYSVNQIPAGNFAPGFQWKPTGCKKLPHRLGFWEAGRGIVFPVHGNQPQPRGLILWGRFWNQPTAKQPQFQRNIRDPDFGGQLGGFSALCMANLCLLLRGRFQRKCSVLVNDASPRPGTFFHKWVNQIFKIFAMLMRRGQVIFCAWQWAPSLPSETFWVYCI